jgi:predicted O-linked N-acetylglucosamine transferase (SPINDLY family)
VAELVPIGMSDPFAADVALHRAGRLDEAERGYRAVLDRNRDHAGALHYLGLIALDRGEAGRALDLIGKALRARPDDPLLNNNLGNARRRLGHRGAALASYRRALAASPALPDAWGNLGALLTEMNAAGEALAAHGRAVRLAPDEAELHFAEGLARRSAGAQSLRRALALDPGLARAWVAVEQPRRALALSPDLPEALVASGAAVLAAGRPREASALLERGRAHPLAAFHRGNALFQLGRLDEAADAFAQVASQLPEAAANLAGVRRDQGRIEEARTAYDRLIAAGAPDWVRLKRALLLPIIPSSDAEIEQARAGLAADLASLSGLRLGDPVTEIGHANFYLAYHGRDDRPLQETIARFYRDACPLLSADLAQAPRRPDGRIAIGIVSTLLRTHTIGRLNRGLIETLDRRRFHVTLIAPDYGADPLAAALARAADRVLRLPPSLAAAQRAIADLRLDLLYFTDIGMGPMTYFLAFARLAPAQVMTWGHPDTTGLGSIDWMLSADCMEPADAEAHYTERLARLSGPTVRVARPRAPARPKSRAELGLPAGRLYVCPQSLFKLHPGGDPVFARILAEDRGGHLVLIQGRHPNWAAQLTARLQRAGADPARIVVLPHLSGDDYLSLLRVADVMLDPIHYSGGHSTLEALAMATPVVTWPGRFMRARHTVGFYRLMGLGALVARDFDDYAAIALRVTQDADERRRLAAAIDDTSTVLFDTASTIRGIEDFLESLVTRA